MSKDKITKKYVVVKDVKGELSVMSSKGFEAHKNILKQYNTLTPILQFNGDETLEDGSEQWMSLDEYGEKVQDAIGEKPVVKSLTEGGTDFKRWHPNIHNLIDKEMNATREVRVKINQS